MFIGEGENHGSITFYKTQWVWEAETPTCNLLLFKIVTADCSKKYIFRFDAVRGLGVRDTAKGDQKCTITGILITFSHSIRITFSLQILYFRDIQLFLFSIILLWHFGFTFCFRFYDLQIFIVFPFCIFLSISSCRTLKQHCFLF